MALANVAWVLASAGLKVLVIDWDLEAPGLHRYLRPFLSDKKLSRLESQGIIDLVSDFSERLAGRPPGSQQLAANWFEPYADITKWTQRLLWPSGEDARTTLGGSIDFVPAGRQDARYAKRVNSFDWAYFYEHYNLGGFLDALRGSMHPYDWVLIDSRTGVSDTAGICTVQFPDILVVCFTLNYQSIEGASTVAASARAARGHRHLRVLPVPMRLDGNEERLLSNMMAYARLAFAQVLDSDLDSDQYWREMGVPYFSRYAYSEKLSPFEDQVNVSTSTLPAVERLTKYLTDGRVSRLESLPEEHRRAALAEFERLPDEIGQDMGPSAVPRRMSRGVFVRRAFIRYPLAAWSLLAVLVLITLLSARRLLVESSILGVSSNVGALIAGAHQAFERQDRERAALLIAEAASRLGPDAVIGPDGDPGGLVYTAFQALQPLVLLNASTAYTTSLQFSPTGGRVITSGSGQPTRLFRFPPRTFGTGAVVGDGAAAFSPDGRLVAVVKDGAVSVVDVEGLGREVRLLPFGQAAVTAITFNPDGRRLAVGNERDVYLYDVATGAQLQRWSHPLTRGFGFGPKGLYIIALDRAGDIVLRDLAERGGEVAQRVPVGVVRISEPEYIFVDTLPGQLNLAVVTLSADGIVELWTAQYGRQRVAEVRAGADVRLAFSLRRMAVASEGRVRVFSIAGGAAVIEEGTIEVTDVLLVAFGANGRQLVTGTREGIVQVWDSTTLREVQRVQARGAVHLAVVTPEGTEIAFGDREGIAWIPTAVSGAAQTARTQVARTFSASEVQAMACSQVSSGTSLTQEEWSRYFGPNEPVRFTCRAEASPTSP